MKKLLFVLLILTSLLAIGCQNPSKVVALGDSITYGLPYGPGGSWVDYINDKKLSVINKGVNGETTGQMLYRFDRDVTDNHPEYVIILGGTNDAFYNLPLQDYASNISGMVNKAEANKITPVLGLPLPVNDETYEKRLNNYRRWLLDYARQNKLQTIDFFSAVADPTTGYIKSEFNFDNVHPNTEGYKKMAGIVKLKNN